MGTMTDELEKGQYYTIDRLRSIGLINTPTLMKIFNFVLDTSKTAQDADVNNNGSSDTSPVMRCLYMPLSFSGDAQKVTTYLDDAIIQGQVFTIRQKITFGSVGTPVYFGADVSPLESLGLISFVLPFVIDPTEGYIELQIYEDSDFTGGVQIIGSNRNRLSSNTQKGLVYALGAGDIADIGTPLSGPEIFGAAGTNQNAGGGAGASANSLILAYGKKYVFSLICSEAEAVAGAVAEFAEVQR